MLYYNVHVSVIGYCIGNNISILFIGCSLLLLCLEFNCAIVDFFFFFFERWCIHFIEFCRMFGVLATFSSVLLRRLSCDTV